MKRDDSAYIGSEVLLSDETQDKYHAAVVQILNYYRPMKYLVNTTQNAKIHLTLTNAFTRTLKCCALQKLGKSVSFHSREVVDFFLLLVQA